MLVKVNSIDEKKHNVNVTVLDIDDFGDVISLWDVDLNLPINDISIIQILKNSPYAAIFTEDNKIGDNATIILANGITGDELNREKAKTIQANLFKKEKRQ